MIRYGFATLGETTNISGEKAVVFTRNSLLKLTSIRYHMNENSAKIGATIRE